MKTGFQNLALDVRDRGTERFLLHEVKGAAWLTYVEGDLLVRAGGAESAKRLVGVDCKDCRDGVLLRAGTEPPVGNLAAGASDIKPLLAVNGFLKPIRATKLLAYNLFRHRDVDQWLPRLDALS
jgi:hypothetical protein